MFYAMLNLFPDDIQRSCKRVNLVITHSRDKNLLDGGFGA